MSDTPETDACWDDKECNILEHARLLERDRDEQCRLLGMSAERECDLRGELERERALAEQRGRLYNTAIGQLKKLQAQVDELNDKIRYNEVESSHNWRNRERDREAIAAWKEARHADMLSNLADTPTDQRIVKYSKAMLK